MEVGIHVLDNPVWHALAGPCAHLGTRAGAAALFDPEVALFAALPDVPDAAAWNDLAELTKTRRTALVRAPVDVPEGWNVEPISCVQMVAPHSAGNRPAFRRAITRGVGLEVTELGDDDVPEMLELVGATRPGPFRPRTVEFGGYIGVRRHGRLIAMAGQRLRLAGYTEISAVCTDPSCRGEGLASALVTILVQRVQERGDQAILHAAADNTSAISIYDQLGFELRRNLDVLVISHEGDIHQ